MSNGPFALTKWYFDCTTADGRTAVGYWASLKWHRIFLTWQALSIWENGHLSFEASIAAPAAMPRSTDGYIVWRAPQLGCDFTAQPLREPLYLWLWGNAEGGLHWRCEAPSAAISLGVARQSRLRGRGYIERLCLTIPPWQLPIQELRWGRWIDDDARHFVVWIDWRGQAPRTWLLIDGIAARGAEVQDACIVGSHAVLTLMSPAMLSSGSLVDVLGKLGSLGTMIPSSMPALRQMQWQSDGVWRRHGFRSLTGTAIHERVVFDRHPGEQEIAFV